MTRCSQRQAARIVMGLRCPTGYSGVEFGGWFLHGFRAPVSNMAQLINVNPTSEHGLYLRLFVTTGGGW
jgi:hypothetical protein